MPKSDGNRGARGRVSLPIFPTIESRACQIWQILVGHAMRRQTLTYQDLAHLLGHNQPKVLYRQLGAIYFYCKQNDLPLLTGLVVNKATGEPGSGFEPDAERGRLRERVYNYNWYGIVPPTLEEYREARVEAGARDDGDRNEEQ